MARPATSRRSRLTATSPPSPRPQVVGTWPRGAPGGGRLAGRRGGGGGGARGGRGPGARLVAGGWGGGGGPPLDARAGVAGVRRASRGEALLLGRRRGS